MLTCSESLARTGELLLADVENWVDEDLPHASGERLSRTHVCRAHPRNSRIWLPSLQQERDLIDRTGKVLSQIRIRIRIRPAGTKNRRGEI